MYTQLDSCRLCKSPNLELLFDVGLQAFTGIFPKLNEPDVAKAPLELVKCSTCDLVQLNHSFDPGDLYGMTYGYRSGLNQSMVRHLGKKIQKIESMVSLSDSDLVLDIGSNDGTTLGSYANKNLKRIGIDPSGTKFLKYYPKDVELIPDFFSAEVVRKKHGDVKAKVITSIAMFYDLPNPQSFVDDISQLLENEGVWVFEQSYLPLMLSTNSYDTICHEHLEYYALTQVHRMLEKADLKIIDLEFNDTNGGSFSVMAAKKISSFPEATEKVQSTLRSEETLGLRTRKPFEDFKHRVEKHRVELRQLLEQIRLSGRTVLGYGASTKGNVLLQYCGITKEDLPSIAEVNPDKFGSRTPGTGIPIIPEAESHSGKPDFYLVLPWHFREGIIRRETEYLENGGAFIFALPHLEVVTETRVYRGLDSISELLIPPRTGHIERGVHIKS